MPNHHAAPSLATRRGCPAFSPRITRPPLRRPRPLPSGIPQRQPRIPAPRPDGLGTRSTISRPACPTTTCSLTARTSRMRTSAPASPSPSTASYRLRTANLLVHPEPPIAAPSAGATPATPSHVRAPDLPHCPRRDPPAVHDTARPPSCPSPVTLHCPGPPYRCPTHHATSAGRAAPHLLP